MEVVDGFIYLGSYVNKNATTEKEISARIYSEAAALKH